MNRIPCEKPYNQPHLFGFNFRDKSHSLTVLGLIYNQKPTSCGLANSGIRTRFQYNYCNTIALFSPPVLLLATSAPTRGALIAAIPFLGYKVRFAHLWISDETQKIAGEHSHEHRRCGYQRGQDGHLQVRHFRVRILEIAPTQLWPIVVSIDAHSLVTHSFPI